MYKSKSPDKTQIDNTNLNKLCTLNESLKAKIRMQNKALH